MKKQYTDPNLSVVLFEDVITTSGEEISGTRSSTEKETETIYSDSLG